MELTEQLRKLLTDRGADLVGIGAMDQVPGCSFKTGVAVAVALPADIVISLKNAPTKEYYELYHTLNARLNEIVTAGELFLKSMGFEAYGQTTSRVTTNPDRVSRLPHKTVATRAGLGWIGKNCLLVTPQYGSAIRISSLLTDAPLAHSEPVSSSRCGGCRLCVEQCPAKALKGALWEAGMPRERIVDIKKCYEKQLEIMTRETGIETDLCGKCFAVCAYTQRYLERAAQKPAGRPAESACGPAF